MKINLNNSASIEQYLANEMTPSERETFTKELIENPALADELKLSQSIDSAIFDENILDLRKKLIAASKNEKHPEQDVPIRILNRRKWLYAAAAFLVICTVISALYLQPKNKVSNDSLFTEYYNSENIVDQTRGGDKTIVEAVVEFQKRDFGSASNLFGNIIKKDKTNIAVWFYYGICNIEVKKFSIAIEAFKIIIQQNDNLYIEHAEWYLGLCYLKNNQKDEALDQFLKVANNPDNYHHKEAHAILQKLQGK